MTTAPNPDLQRWNKKYDRQKSRNGLTVDPAGEPELLQYGHLLDGTGLAIEAACGKGQNALYLASLGYQVIACDGAYFGLEICHRSARRLGLPVSALVCDLEVFALPESAFGLVSVVRYLHRPLFNQLKSTVAPGGLIFYKTFNTHFLSRNPDFNPDYVLQTGELNRVFSDFEIRASDFGSTMDGSNAPTPTSFILARRPPG